MLGFGRSAHYTWGSSGSLRLAPRPANAVHNAGITSTAAGDTSSYRGSGTTHAFVLGGSVYEIRADGRGRRRLEEAADSLGESHGGSLDAPRVRLALHRGELGAVERLLVESERRPPKLIRSTKFAPVAARLDALAALGNRDRVEDEAPALLRPNTYLEPFALRALALVRSEQRLIEQAATQFDALGLDWYASQTRALV